MRLRTEPMKVPESMLALLDFIIVMKRTQQKGKGSVRHVTFVAEISRMEDKTLLSDIFEFDASDRRIKRTNIPSHIIEDLAEKSGLTKNDLRREMLLREKVLDWMLEKGIRKSEEVQKIIKRYYFDQHGLLGQISKELET